MGEAAWNLAEWSVEELVGQLLMVGFPGRALPAALAEALRTGRMGNIILFSRNLGKPEEVAQLTRTLQEASLASPRRVPLLIALDQEGGSVTRLWHRAARFPGNMALGAVADEALSEQVGRAMGEELAALGLNFDLAPVLDVNNNPANPVIGTRSFGDDPEAVARLGVAWLRGLQQAGVAACAKHFPGHGDTRVDSHLALPVIPHGWKRLEAVELLPFRRAVAARVAAVMTAHVHFPAVEPEPGRPATLSRAVLEGLLRERLGFQGVIITDCLEMQAIAATVGTVEGAVQAVTAGADVVLISHTWEFQEAAARALVQAVETGRIARERVEQSVCRVLAVKAGLGFIRKGAPVLERLQTHPEQVGREANLRLAAEASRRAVTLVGPREGLPLRPELATETLVVEVLEAPRSNAEDGAGVGPSLAGVVADALPGAVVRRLKPDEVEGALDDLVPRARQARQVVVAVRNAARSEAQGRLLSALAEAAGRRMVGVALRSPYDAALLPEATWLLTYSDQPPAVEAAARVLLGRAEALGRLPVRLTLVSEA